MSTTTRFPNISLPSYSATASSASLGSLNTTNPKPGGDLASQILLISPRSRRKYSISRFSVFGLRFPMKILSPLTPLGIGDLPLRLEPPPPRPLERESRDLGLRPLVPPVAISTRMRFPFKLRPSKSSQESLASLQSSNVTNPYPGGFLAIHIASILPDSRKNFRTSISLVYLSSPPT